MSRERGAGSIVVDLAAKVAFLKQAGNYPEPTRSVEVKETHMSWVFLTDRFAYKLKKPATTSFLDYGTIAARRLNCQREVRLNRRLAPDIYLGVEPLTYDAPTGLHIGGAGRVVDWLVKMRRLPAERTLEHMISVAAITETKARRLGRRLALFFRRAPVAGVLPQHYLHNFADMIHDNHAELARADFGLPRDEVDRLAAAQILFLRREGEMLQNRVLAQRIREGHGDLRPEHIYIDGAPVIVDCLEFSARLRRLDPVDELAYLAMECDRLGARQVGPWVLDSYRRETGDSPPDALIGFYKCFRACLRAKIAIWHLDDPSVAKPERWHWRARHYLRWARAYARSLPASQRGRYRRAPARISPPVQEDRKSTRFHGGGARPLQKALPRRGRPAST